MSYNIASMFENKSSEWQPPSAASTNPKVELSSVLFSELNLIAKAKGSESDEDWHLLAEIVQVPKAKFSPNEKFATLWAQKTTLWANTVAVYFELNKDFLQRFEEIKMSPLSIEVTGSVKTETYSYSGYDHYWTTYGSAATLRANVSDSRALKLELVKGELFQEVIKNGASKLAKVLFSAPDSQKKRLQINWSLSLKWETMPRAKLGVDNILSKMFACESSKDLTVVVANGIETKCHKVVFAAHSPAFAAMIAPESEMIEAKTSRVELADLSKDGIGYLIPYFYGMELPIFELKCGISAELFQAAHKYGLAELEKKLEKWLLKNDFKWFTADVVIELYYFSKNLEQYKNLEKHLLLIMTQIPAAIRACESYQSLGHHERENLTWKLFYTNRK